ncbi:hypothetical protein MNEG_13009 [Monoraphidium neglectum]|uniref:Uncharacterized protein n=1 Tax=Monoraphidium neglectum TaxID=145388 RepID=A0A0D2J4U1_9CHLO|nr:hypothetical protein MNEG_13009 [Monoraphidium neglectum]KIY94952.1 hypothetical protein MNEG_13009 [Monoraphidium neglectum]|eukprot:XP_013893972.1 hypothetical protein MNEG_13009 [Monoraphidium neglectum]
MHVRSTQVNYPNGRTGRSQACTITVTDTTNYGPPILNTANTCFYLNDTKLTNIDIPVSLLATVPAGNKCSNIRVVATACAPEFKNKGRTKRVCLPVVSPGTAVRPIPATAVDLLKKNFLKNPQPITVTLNTFDLNGQLGKASVNTSNVVVYRKKPRASIAANCIPVFNRI